MVHSPTSKAVLFAAALTFCVYVTPGFAASEPVLGLPNVQARVKVVESGGGRALLIKSLTIQHDPGIRTRISCRSCSRLISPRPRETHPNADVTRYLDLNWIIRGNRHIEVLVVQPGAIGRYLLLGIKPPLSVHSLGVRASGCLNSARQRINCPAGEESNPLPNPGEKVFEETVGGDTHTWSDYHNGSGEGALIPSGETVTVSCRVEGLVVQDKNPWWYRIASSPWGDRYYASADAFYNNGQKTGSLEGTPFYDPQVPTC